MEIPIDTTLWGMVAFFIAALIFFFGYAMGWIKGNSSRIKSDFQEWEEERWQRELIHKIEARRHKQEKKDMRGI